MHDARDGAALLRRVRRGALGRQLVRQALDRGHAVTVLVRKRARLDLQHPKLTEVEGNVLDRASVDRAMRGSQAVISALGHRRFLYPSRVLTRGTRVLLDSMSAQGVRRFLCVTAMGIGDSAGRLGLAYTFFIVPVVLPFYFWDKARQERLIAGSATNWTIVRPAVLTGGAQMGRCRHGPDAGGYILTRNISRADVACFMLDELLASRFLGRAVSISRG